MTSGPPRDTESDVPDWVNAPAAPAAPAGAAASAGPTTPSAPPPPTPSTAWDDPPGDGDWHDDPEAGEPLGADPTWRPSAVRRGRRRGGAHWGRRLLAAAGVLVLILVGLGAGLVVWVNGHLNGSGGAPVVVTLPAQAGHAQIASTLTRSGVVSDSWLFRHYLDYRGTQPVTGGQYTFHHGEGYRSALRDLGLGPKVVQFRLTIPEGYDLRQISAAVGRLPGMSAQRFLSLAQSGTVRSRYEPAGVTSLEGLVFPDTYFINQDQHEQDILQTMVDRFDQVADEQNLATKATANGLTPYQTVVLASLIEKEAKVEQDRGRISRVILNRLARHMKLQIDATIEYAEGVHKAKLLNSDLQVNSPYNTYRIDGLPPGPIASPGLASLQAALDPTPGTWLYYVLINPDGEHAFAATTQKEFDQLLATAQARGLR